MATRDELVAAIAGRYSQAERTQRSHLLDEFTSISGFHRKHAMRPLDMVLFDWIRPCASAGWR